MHPLGHLKTITHHKLLVMGYCFRVGLIRQGLLHDLSKYSWTEFRVGAKYYSGTRSPNAAEREVLGYSTAWMHHKGRNKHHLEYWTDNGRTEPALAPQPMPTKYMVELCLDRIAACRVYQGKDYTDRSPLEYLNRSRDSRMMHPRTKGQVVELLTMLAERGEKETLRHIRRVTLREAVPLYPNLPPETPPEEKDGAFLSGDRAAVLAAEMETPFMIYDRRGIEAACQTLRQAFAWAPGWRQFFPVKATPTPAILRLLREQGQGVVCSSAAELTLCARCGFRPEEILFMPNFPTDEDLRAAAALRCGVLLDGPGLVEKYDSLGLLGGVVGLRLNPGGVFRCGDAEAALDGVKFGFTPEAALECALALKARGVQAIGVHAYLLGNTLEPEYYPRLAETLLPMARTLAEQSGLRIGYIDLSGGLGIPYRPGEKPLDLLQVGQRVRAVFETQCAGTPLEGVAVYTELGRILTGPAGLLVTRVTHVRRGHRSVAGVDASAANLMRPMMYGAYHHISVAGRAGETERAPWDVVGTVCENSDKFAENRMLPDLSVGDLLLIHDAGAHGHSMGYQYGGRLRCGEYLLEPDGTARQIRRPETAEDWLATAVWD